MTQPEALRLADALEQQFPLGTAQEYLDGEAAAELRRLHARVTELEAQAVPAALFDAEGFREWETRNMPDDTIIGSSAWWAAMRKQTRTVTYVCPVCAASLERQE